MSDYYILDSENVDPARLKKEREKARELRKTGWWKNQLSKGVCHYCGQKFKADELTMDHVVPLARGGRSVKGNLVPSCMECNQKKRLETPAEAILKKLSGNIVGLIAMCLLVWGSVPTYAGDEYLDGPHSSFIELEEAPGLNPALCAEWNPEYRVRGGLCCGRAPAGRRTLADRCSRERIKNNYCDEMTPEQVTYIEDVKLGRADVLAKIDRDRRVVQAFCSYHDGFLVRGRPLVATEKNRLTLRNPQRCVHFGTDEMVGMLEWVGRRVAERYSGEGESNVKLLVGDISAPRGGCLIGAGGRRGHLSHTSGRDVDLGFLSLKHRPDRFPQFVREFDSELNWWLLKQVFNNPYACIKTLFLDRRLIAKLRKHARGDPDWDKYSHKLRHVRHHGNHYHIRVDGTPGPLGCSDSNDSSESDLISQIRGP